MKKLLNKIKLKYLARVGLVMILTCYLMTFLCSAAQTVNVSFNTSLTVPNGYTISVGIGDFEDNSLSLVKGGTVSVPFSPKFNTKTGILFVTDGDCFIVTPDGNDLLISDVNVDDGYYQIVFTTKNLLLAGADDKKYMLTVDGENVESVSNVDVEDDATLASFVVLTDVVDVELTTVETDIDEISQMMFVLVEALSPPQESITNVWSGIMTFITSSLNSVTGIFWNGTSLTLIGTLAVVGVSIAILLLVFNKIKDFLRLQ